MSSIFVRLVAIFFAMMVGFEMAALYLGWFFSPAYGVFWTLLAFLFMLQTASEFEECDELQDKIRECDEAIRWCREEKLKIINGCKQ